VYDEFVPRGGDLHNPLRLETAPIRLGAGKTGVLLLHGYLATPAEMRGLAEYLAARGLRVHAPRVAGHGTSLRELCRTTWRDWYASVEEAYAGLQTECSRVFAAGMSLGGLQALHLAAHHPELAGVAALAPPVTGAKAVMRRRGFCTRTYATKRRGSGASTTASTRQGACWNC